MIKVELKKNQGFTLLEALVAISILMMAVTAPITIAQKGLSSAVYSKNQMIASYLAQDAIEYIKNVRDQVVINSNNFDWNNLSIFGDSVAKTKCFEDNGCKVDTLGTDVNTSITVYAGEYLRKDSDTGLYSYDQNDSITDYTRKINIKLDPNNDSDTDDALVTATVSWKGGNEVVVKTLIYNY